MANLKEQIQTWFIANKEEAIKFFQQLVQSPSTQGNEAVVQNVIATKLRDLGLEVDMWELDYKTLNKHPNFFSNRKRFKGSPNVVGVLKGTKKGRSIVLNGHVDVVPPGDLTQWERDPFSAEIKDGKLYGRGATDMKGGNLALYLAVLVIKQLNIELKGDIIFHSVVEEESGGAGTLAAIMKQYTADAAIIPEPTDMRIFPKQQGSKWFRLKIKGRSAHGGTRYHGVSAIEKSATVVSHLLQLEKIRNDRITDPLYDNIPIPVPINVGKIEGGDWPSSVCDLVQLEGRIGIAPNETVQQVQDELAYWLLKIDQVDPWFEDHPVELEWFGAEWLPGSIEHDHPLMTILQTNFEHVVGEKPKIEASPWGTDGGLLTEVGKTPTIVFGPGKSALAHFPNEYIELDDIFKAAQIIALTIINWCELSEEREAEK